MELKPDNRYAEYFNSLRASHGGLPPHDFKALIEQQLGLIRNQLVESQFAPEAIETEMALARSAAEADLPEPGLQPVSKSAPMVEEKTATQASTSMKGQALLKWLVSQRMLAGMLALFAVAYILVLVLFLREGHPRMVIKGVSAESVAIEAQFISIDLARETITMTLLPDLSSSQIASRGKLTSEINVEIDTGVLVLSHTFKSGDIPVPWIATIPIEEGDILQYPFDHYAGDFRIKASRKGSSETIANLELDKVVHGFQFSATGEPSPDKTQLNVAYEVSRSPAVIFLTIMGMLSLTLVVFSAINVAWRVAVNGRKAEFNMMTWIAALLFVIPSVRNSIPGSPPTGALIDVALFFWLHILAVSSLLTIVWNWSKQT